MVSPHRKLKHHNNTNPPAKSSHSAVTKDSKESPSATDLAQEKVTLKLRPQTRSKTPTKTPPLFARKVQLKLGTTQRIPTNSNPTGLAPQKEPFSTPTPENPPTTTTSDTITSQDSDSVKILAPTTSPIPTEPALENATPNSNVVATEQELTNAVIQSHDETHGNRASESVPDDLLKLLIEHPIETMEKINTPATPIEKPTDHSIHTGGNPVKLDGRRTNGKHLTSELASKMRKKRSFYALAQTPPLRCDNCTFSAQCPQFKPSFECAFGGVLNNIKLASITDIQEFKTALLEADLQRVQFGLIQERLAGGVIDPNVSARLDAAYSKLNQQAQAYLASQQAAITRPVDSTTLTIHAENTGNGASAKISIFERLFGQFSPPKPTTQPVTENLKVVPPPQPVPEQMVVEEVTTTKRTEVSDLISKLP